MVRVNTKTTFTHKLKTNEISMFLHKKSGSVSQYRSCKQILTRGDRLVKHLNEERRTGAKAKIVLQELISDTT